ncbi:MAG: hypothetical protein ACD_28C00317G0022 [uncultured bacterium]|nr:MAG: hypothetical protein ACD_28C00317G0022 [uncultured bacterium]
MEDCLFCKIVQKQIPSRQEYEDEHCLIFHDIHPKATTHLLIIPKKHIPTLMDLEEGDEKIMGHLMRAAKQMGEKLNLEGYKLQCNVGQKGGQEVFHLHLHLLA